MFDFLRAIAIRLHNEPVLLRTVAGGLVALAAIFGVTVDDASLDPVIDLIGLLAGILIGASARQRVTPVG